MYLSCGFYFRQERRIACYAENEQEAEKWLWYPYIPFDKVALLQGDPGDGKSKLMLSIAALLSNGERNGEKQQGGYELCKGKKYTVSDVSKAERHNERKNETYENINMIEERIPYNVHFKKPFAPTYMEKLKQMEADGMVSLRGLRKDATLFNEIAIKCKDGFDNKWNNKYVEVTEQVGRLGCFGFMIINIPGTWFGWWSDEALALSIIPSMLFLFSGIMSRSVLLIIASVLFAPSHIVISYKNVK